MPNRNIFLKHPHPRDTLFVRINDGQCSAPSLLWLQMFHAEFYYADKIFLKSKLLTKNPGRLCSRLNRQLKFTWELTVLSSACEAQRDEGGVVRCLLLWGQSYLTVRPTVPLLWGPGGSHHPRSNVHHTEASAPAPKQLRSINQPSGKRRELISGPVVSLYQFTAGCTLEINVTNFLLQNRASRRTFLQWPWAAKFTRSNACIETIWQLLFNSTLYFAHVQIRLWQKYFQILQETRYT